MSLLHVFRSGLAAIGVAAALAACTQAPPQPSYPALTYGHLGAFRLDVARVEIVDEYEPPLKLPNVEHEFPVTPAAAARRWANDRLQAAGTKGLARAIVREASVVEVPLAKTTGVTGMVTTDQAERYDARLVMEIEIRSERGYKDAYVRAEAARSRSVPENISLNDREQMFFVLTEDLMGDINAQLEKQIERHFVRFLR